MLAAQQLDPAGFVDRRADHREIEAVGAADVAVEHVAEVEGDVEVEDQELAAARSLHRMRVRSSVLTAALRARSQTSPAGARPAERWRADRRP